MNAILSLIPTELLVAAGGFIAAALAFLVGQWSGVSKGRLSAGLDALENDVRRAREIEDKANAVDNDGNSAERLRESDSLRD